MAGTPIGPMNHFTLAAPDVPAAMHFWIDFMGGDWYSESDRLDQVLLGGILVDLFPPLDEAAAAAPGDGAQRFRFSIEPDSVAAWIEKAEEWLVRTSLEVQEELLRLILVVDSPGGYHVGLEATYASSSELWDAVARHKERVSRLDRLAERVR